MELPAGSWSNVSVAMDLENITFNVNGKSEEKAFPYQGYFFKPSVFGGHVYPAFAMPSSNTKFFKGDLRFIRILHGIENKKQISKKATLKGKDFFPFSYSAWVQQFPVRSCNCHRLVPSK